MILRVIGYLSNVSLSFRTDDFGPLIYPAYLAGYDWKSLISNINYYGYYWIFAPLFKLPLNAAGIVITISIINSVFIALSSAYIYRLLKKYFQMPDSFFTAVLSVVPTLFEGDALAKNVFYYHTDNEIPLYFLCWLLVGVTLKAYTLSVSEENVFFKKIVTGVMAGLVLVGTLSVHERSAAIVLAVIAVEILYLIKRKKFLFQPVSFFGTFAIGFLLHRLIRSRILSVFWGNHTEIKNTSAFSDVSSFFLASKKGIQAFFTIWLGNWHSAFVHSLGIVCVAVVLVLYWIFHRESVPSDGQAQNEEKSILITMLFGITTFIVITGLGVRWGEKFYEGLVENTVVYGYKGICYTRYYFTFTGPIFVFTLLYLYQKREQLSLFVKRAVWLLFLAIEGSFFLFAYRFCSGYSILRNRTIAFFILRSKNLTLTMFFTALCVLFCTYGVFCFKQRRFDTNTGKRVLYVAVLMLSLHFLQRGLLVHVTKTNAAFVKGSVLQQAITAAENADHALLDPIYVSRDNHTMREKFYLQLENRTRSFSTKDPEEIADLDRVHIFIRNTSSSWLIKRGYRFIFIEGYYVYTNQKAYIKLWRKLGLEDIEEEEETEKPAALDKQAYDWN